MEAPGPADKGSSAWSNGLLSCGPHSHMLAVCAILAHHGLCHKDPSLLGEQTNVCKFLLYTGHPCALGRSCSIHLVSSHWVLTRESIGRRLPGLDGGLGFEKRLEMPQRWMYSPWTCTIGSHVLWFVCLQMTWDFQDQAFPKPTPSFLECRISVIFWVPGTLELPIYVCLHRLVWASLFLLTIDYSINVHILRHEGWRKCGCMRRLGPKGFVRSNPSHEALWYRMELGVRI